MKQKVCIRININTILSFFHIETSISASLKSCLKIANWAELTTRSHLCLLRKVLLTDFWLFILYFFMESVWCDREHIATPSVHYYDGPKNEHNWSHVSKQDRKWTAFLATVVMGSLCAKLSPLGKHKIRAMHLMRSDIISSKLDMINWVCKQ